MVHFAHIQGCKCQEGSDPEAVFQAIAETLEVLISYWNHINEIYSDIKQGDDESIDKLDQCIKNLVKKCQYTEVEKLGCRTKLLFHATKYFEVKKWVPVEKEARRCNICSTTSVCQGTRDDSERFQLSQVKQRNHPTDNYQCDWKFQMQ